MIPEPARPIQIIAPLEDAWKTMRHILFNPFDFKKWCALGFCAWLANLMSSGSSGGNINSSSNDNGSSADSLWSGIEWASPWVITLIVVVSLMVIALLVTLTWVSSRGKFMFLDCIVHNRALIKQPWEEFKSLAWQLFLFRLIVGVFWVVVIAAVVLAGVLAGIAAHEAGLIHQLESSGGADPSTIAFIVAIAVCLLTLVILISAFHFLVENFMIPLMYRRKLSAYAAWKVTWNLLLENIVPMLLFILMSLAVSFATAIAAFLTCCLTCCLILIPYVGTVILLPLFVFGRAYGLHFLAQFSDDLQLFSHQSIIRKQPTPPALPPLSV